LVTAAFAGLREWAGGAVTRIEANPLRRDARRVMDLPAGFSYTSFSRAGDLMDDGLLVPGKHDGMGAFAGPGGTTILVRNHELAPEWAEQSAWRKRQALLRRIPREKFYDWGKGKNPGLGGTTTVIFDTKTGVVEREWLSLIGTNNNCAGGVMPWGSWITCEEATQIREKDTERDHGYNFEVPASARGLVDPQPIKAMGRFRHEAVARWSQHGIIYQTEDRNDGLLYRYLPKEPEKLLAGGKLQALRLRDQPRADTRNYWRTVFQPGAKHAVEWVDVENVESPDDDLRYQGFYEDGCARFARGEGIWTGTDAIYFACTDGGTKRKGQIWRYFPSPAEGTAAEAQQPGQLELFIEPNDGALVENCDNVTMAPWGDLIVCEDGTSPQYLVGVRPDGSTYQFGRTTISELAGACFSPDGSTLFVNIQSPGVTVAITGPWKQLARMK
jgi:secreted PhoX family phosphatase